LNVPQTILCLWCRGLIRRTARAIEDSSTCAENPYDLDHLPEARTVSSLMHALRALNALDRRLHGEVRCMPLDGEELDALRVNLDAQRRRGTAGFGSYIDILWRERSLFASFHLQEQMLHRLTGTLLLWSMPTRCSIAFFAPRWSTLQGRRRASR